MAWSDELGFESNPFELNPLKTDFNLVGREEEAKEILYRIASGSMSVIEGKVGVGKTSVLKHAIDNFKGEGKVIYVDGNILNKRLNVNELIKKKPKGMILLLDNVQNLSKKNNVRIKYYYDEDYIKSIVFTTTDYGLVKFTDSIKGRIGNNIIKLKDLTQSNSLEIVKNRLSNKDILPDSVLKELFKQSSNIKEFLRNCDSICSYIVENGKEKAEPEDIKKIRKEDLKEVDEKVDICSECNEKLVKINDYWRCKNCDKYCAGCGALVDEEDKSCPECGIELKRDKE